MLRSTSRLLPLALALALAACQDGTDLTGPGSRATGKGFTLLLTDAPGDFVSAVVTISQITIQGDGQAVPLLDEPYTGDLLDLQNEVATLVQGKELPAGSYSQLRLLIAGAYLEVETTGGTRIYASSPNYEGLPDGAVVYGTLHMPSMGQSGLKINLPGGRVTIGEGETIVLLDFDAAESFGHEAGNSGRWVMHPVIKATGFATAAGVLATLKLGDGVTLPSIGTPPAPVTLAQFKAQLTPAGGTAREVAFTDANGDGTFEASFPYLVPGSYALTLLKPAGINVTYDVTLPVALTLASGAVVTKAFVITAASAGS